MIRSLEWKRLLGWAFGKNHAYGRDVILIYHSVNGGILSTLPDRFSDQMGWLSCHAQVVSLDTMLGTQNKNELRVVLSFDDGYETLFRTVRPILSEHAFPAIVYLNSGLIGEAVRRSSDVASGHYPNEQFMLWSEVEALVTAGWCVGGHGVEHLDLTRENRQTVADQLTRCRAEIETRLQRPCKHFAYTWGHYNDQVRQAVRESGYQSAVAGIHGPVCMHTDSYALPRIDVRADYELRDFADIVTGRWDFLRIKQTINRLMR